MFPSTFLESNINIEVSYFRNARIISKSKKVSLLEINIGCMILVMFTLKGDIQMGKGIVLESEITSFQDNLSKVKIIKLTNYFGHSFHLYFTNIGWYDQNKKLLICSDRDNCTNLYSLNLETGRQTQLSDFSTTDQTGIHGTYINPVKNVAYFTVNEYIIALNLDSFAEEKLFKLPTGYRFSNLSCTADGKYLCFGISEDLSDRIKSNLTGGYVGFEETEAARPTSKIYELNLDTKEAMIIHEEKRWIGHINTSPTQSHLLTFCREGPWDVVDHRIWVLDRNTGQAWKVREGNPNEYAGHEYWHEDGVTIGYHGFTDSLEKKDRKFLGYVKYDNTEQYEVAFPYQNMHIHSNNSTLIVGDGQQTSAYHGETFKDCIFLWRKLANGYEGPRILCRHRGSFQTQKVHVHPRISPDGSKVIFTSDMEGYGNVYLVEIPPFEELPHAIEIRNKELN